jgi:hypothetical protein
MSDRSRDSPENRRFISAEVRFLNDGQAKMAAIEEIRRWTGGKLGKKGSSGKNGSGMPQIVLESSLAVHPPSNPSPPRTVAGGLMD